MSKTNIEGVRKSGELFYANEVPDTGVVFLLCSWSESALYLKYLTSILDVYSSVPLFIIDIDSDLYLNFSSRYETTSHGKGETFWLYRGDVCSRVTDYEIERDNAIINTQQLLSMITTT